MEQGLLNLRKLSRVHNLEDVFDLVEKHDLLRAVDLGPVPEETENDLLGEGRIFLEELHDTVGQLRVVHTEALDLVQGDEHSRQEQLVFFLERQCEAVDDRAEYLEKLCNTIEPFRLVYELEEDIIDRPSDE